MNDNIIRKDHYQRCDAHEISIFIKNVIQTIFSDNQNNNVKEINQIKIINDLLRSIRMTANNIHLANSKCNSFIAVRAQF